MHLKRDPRINLPILIQNSIGSDETTRIEDNSWPVGILLQHRATLNIDVMLPGLLYQAVCVLVRNRYSEVV